MSICSDVFARALDHPLPPGVLPYSILADTLAGLLYGKSAFFHENDAKNYKLND